jgi:uncharacterized OsmC-like protein
VPDDVVTFQNRRRERLSARLERPVDGAPAAYALFAHGFTCSKDLKAVGEIVKALGRAGIAVRTETGLRTEAMTNGFGLILDEPVTVGGSNTGPTPNDLLATALAACTSMTLRLYADRKKWPLQAVMVDVVHRKVHVEDSEATPERLDLFERRIEVEGPLDEEQRVRLLQIADRCPVHRTLSSEVRIVTHLGEPEPRTPSTARQTPTITGA